MYEQEMKLAKVKKSCKTAKIVARILSILTGIASLGTAVSGICLLVWKATINEALAIAAGNGEFLARGSFETHGIISFAVDFSKFFEEGQYAEGLAAACIFACVICIAATVIFGLIAKTFVKLENSESPFSPEIIGALKKVFITITVVTGLMVGLGDAVMLGLVLWCIYCIMDYGCVLQEEVDDTI